MGFILFFIYMYTNFIKEIEFIDKSFPKKITFKQNTITKDFDVKVPFQQNKTSKRVKVTEKH